MKYLFYAFFILFCFTSASCNSGGAVREQVIVEYVRSNFSGIKPEYRVTVPVHESKGEITVADSLAVLSEQFDTDRASKIRQSETLLETLRPLAALQASNRFASQAEREASQTGIRRQEAVLDSMQALELPAVYVGRKGTEVLARIVRGHISVSETAGGRTLEDVYDFYTSPDGKTIYSHKKAK